LLLAVIHNLEVFFVKPGHGAAVRIPYHSPNYYHIGLNAKPVIGLARFIGDQRRPRGLLGIYRCRAGRG